MNGGHFFTVMVSPPTVGLNAFCGSALNHSGSPCTAGVGRGMTFSSPRGQRKVKVISVTASITASLAKASRRAARRGHLAGDSRRTGAGCILLGDVATLRDGTRNKHGAGSMRMKHGERTGTGAAHG